MALCRAFPILQGEVRLTTNLIDSNKPCMEDLLYTMIERVRNNINKDIVKAVMSMADAWTCAVSDWVARVQSQYKKACPKLELLAAHSL